MEWLGPACVLVGVGTLVWQGWPRTRLLSRLLGLRQPGTSGWEGAWVAYEENGTIVAGRFRNNMDFIAHPKNWAEVERTAAQLQQDGWLPMTSDDIWETSHVQAQ